MSWAAAIAACNSLIIPEPPTEGNDDFKLPNIKELLSLLDYGQTNPALPLEHPFKNVQVSYYWTNSTYENDNSKAWAVNMSDGSIITGDKTTDNFYVWPVRIERHK